MSEWINISRKIYAKHGLRQCTNRQKAVITVKTCKFCEGDKKVIRKRPDQIDQEFIRWCEHY